MASMETASNTFGSANDVFQRRKSRVSAHGSPLEAEMAPRSSAGHLADALLPDSPPLLQVSSTSTSQRNTDQSLHLSPLRNHLAQIAATLLPVLPKRNTSLTASGHLRPDRRTVPTNIKLNPTNANRADLLPRNVGPQNFVTPPTGEPLQIGRVRKPYRDQIKDRNVDDTEARRRERIRRDKGVERELERVRWLRQKYEVVDGPHDGLELWDEVPHILDRGRIENALTPPYTHLYLPGQELYAVNVTNLVRFPKITHVELSENRLKLGDLRELVGAEHINLASNEATEIGELKGWLPNLQTLDLSFNRLPSASLNILGTLESLVELNLSGNKLKSWPVYVNGFPQLKKLILTENELTADAILPAVAYFPQLTHLILDENPIGALTKGFLIEGFQHLIELSLVKTALAEPDDIRCLERASALRRLKIAQTPLWVLLRSGKEAGEWTLSHEGRADFIGIRDVLKARNIAIVDLNGPEGQSVAPLRDVPEDEMVKVKKLEELYPALFGVETEEETPGASQRPDVSLPRGTALERRVQAALSQKTKELRRERDAQDETVKVDMAFETARSTGRWDKLFQSLHAKPAQAAHGSVSAVDGPFLTEVAITNVPEEVDTDVPGYIDTSLPGTLAESLRLLRGALQTNGKSYWRRLEHFLSNESDDVKDHINASRNPIQARNRRQQDGEEGEGERRFGQHTSKDDRDFLRRAKEERREELSVLAGQLGSVEHRLKGFQETINNILSKDIAHQPLYRQSKTLLQQVQKEAKEMDRLAQDLQILLD